MVVFDRNALAIRGPAETLLGSRPGTARRKA